MSTVFKINGQDVDGEKQIETWITVGIEKTAIEYAKKFGENLATLKEGSKDQSLSTSQIRNIFGSVKKIEMKGFSESDFLLLKPKLAYSAKRARVKAAEEFKDVFSKGIDAVISGKSVEEKKEKFNMFCKFFEAVLAYHRAKGGN